MKRIITSFMIALALGMGLVSAKPAQAGDPMLGTIIGAVGGGLLGSTVGKGDGRLVATAAGSVIGAVIGREVASNDYDYNRVERSRERVKERVVYREPPRTKVIVVEKDRHPKYKEHSYKKDRYEPKWKRSARYGDDVLVCRNGSKRCQWYD